MPDVRSICAIGLRGQMGLNGVLTALLMPLCVAVFQRLP